MSVWWHILPASESPPAAEPFCAKPGGDVKHYLSVFSRSYLLSTAPELDQAWHDRQVARGLEPHQGMRDRIDWQFINGQLALTEAASATHRLTLPGLLLECTTSWQSSQIDLTSTPTGIKRQQRQTVFFLEQGRLTGYHHQASTLEDPVRYAPLPETEQMQQFIRSLPDYLRRE